MIFSPRVSLSCLNSILSFIPQITLAIRVLTSSLGVGDRDISRVVAGGVSSRVAEGVAWGVGGVAEGVVEGVVWGVVGGSARFAELVGRCCQGWRWWCSIADLGGGCCAGRFLVGCEIPCCWDLAGLWRGVFAVIGFTHPQPNFAKIQSDCGKNYTISCYLGSMLL